MKVKILCVSDTHEAFEVLEKIVSTEKDIDLVIHSGDFATINGWDETKQSEAIDSFNRTIDILRSYGKPVICVLGNHDASILFSPETSAQYRDNEVYILGHSPVEVHNIRFIGLGGAPPGMLPDGTEAFPGFPYRTTDDCEEIVRNRLFPQVNETKSILITHAPPFDLGILPFKGLEAEAGSREIQRLIEENSQKIALSISGHYHRQLWVEQYHGTSALNPGSALQRNYAVLEVELEDGCRVVSADLKFIEE